MRVRISYGVEIEDIPDQAVFIANNALIELKEACQILVRALDCLDDEGADLMPIVKNLSKIRPKLTKSDSIIVDTMAILEGLNNYYNGEENVSEGRPTMDPGGDFIEQRKDSGEG